MKYLKIDDNKGYYRIDASVEDWIELDQINKEHLLTLLNIATEQDFEMDEFKHELLQNPAHNIIYRNVYNKFIDLLANKTRFQDTADSLYKDALEKYKPERSGE